MAPNKVFLRGIFQATEIDIGPMHTQRVQMFGQKLVERGKGRIGVYLDRVVAMKAPPKYWAEFD